MQKIYFVGANERIGFYELWEQHKQLKTKKMNEAWHTIYNEGCVHQFQNRPIYKIQQQKQ